MTVDVELYPHQCRMARASARLSRQSLATMSGVSVRTICAFEATSSRSITKANKAAIRAALETAGVRFTGFGVDLSRLEKRTEPQDEIPADLSEMRLLLQRFHMLDPTKTARVAQLQDEVAAFFTVRMGCTRKTF